MDSNVPCPECGEQAWQHPAGPCLDRWVARLVFQKEPCALWKQVNMGSAGGPMYLKQCSHDEGRCYPATPVPTIQGTLGGCPRYSTEMAFAWQVVERIAAEGACPGLINNDFGLWALAVDGMQNLPQNIIEEGATQSFDCDTTFFVEAARWADTAPLAICRACIVNYGEDKEP